MVTLLGRSSSHNDRDQSNLLDLSKLADRDLIERVVGEDGHNLQNPTEGVCLARAMEAALLVGTDYWKGLSGVGWATAIRLITEHADYRASGLCQGTQS
jgi:5'-3' exonuclease